MVSRTDRMHTFTIPIIGLNMFKSVAILNRRYLLDEMDKEAPFFIMKEARRGGQRTKKENG